MVISDTGTKNNDPLFSACGPIRLPHNSFISMLSSSDERVDSSSDSFAFSILSAVSSSVFLIFLHMDLIGFRMILYM